MNIRSISSTTVVIAALSLAAFAGCYTKLMPFREAVALRHAAVSTTGGTTADAINYSDNCLSCHSEAELNDRTSEINQADFFAIHGVAYDPYGWQNPYVQPPWWNPTTTIIYTPGAGGVPVITTGRSSGGSSSAAAKTTTRKRESGSSRGDEQGRSAAPAPATSATSTPTTTTSSAPPPTSTPVPVVTTPPAQTPPAQAPETRSRSNEGGSHTRKSGSGRE